MARLKLVEKFGSIDTTGMAIIKYTPRGKEFLRILHAVTSQEPSLREASLIALDLLAAGKPTFGGPLQK
jgi:hypothetical protein